MIFRLVSGGQTGVDRAALDVALELGIACGGWCPHGRKAEDGRIPDRYPLQETPSSEYGQRTEWNVRDSDGTLVLAWGEPAGGTLLTVNVCHAMGKPCLVIDLADAGNLASCIQTVREWVATHLAHGVLNVAGPRFSESPAASERARVILQSVLRSVDARPAAQGAGDIVRCGGP